MSKERARRREQRQLATAHRLAEQQAARQKAADRARRRAALRRAFGRRSGRQASARTRERRAVVGSLLLVIALTSWLLTGSVGIVVGVMLIAAIALPALVTTLFDRSRK
jgi:Flp pilus assembly protein TadB